MNSKFNYKAAVQAINFFIRKQGDTIDKKKVVKLLWLAERLHLLKSGCSLFNDSLFALRQGPILSNSLDLMNEKFDKFNKEIEGYSKSYFRNLNGIKLTSIREVDLLEFSDFQEELLEQIFTSYGMYDADEISQISHQFPEWKRFEENLNKAPKSRHKIVLNDIFDISVEMKSFEFDQEYRESAKDLFNDNLLLSSAL